MDSSNSHTTQQLNSDHVTLIQLTDTHIFSNPSETFDGINTEQTLKQVIAYAKQTSWPPNAVLVTGDLVHDPVPASYQRLTNILKDLDCPTFCIPGNHDEPETMKQHLPINQIMIRQVIHFDFWMVIMLDTWLPDTHAGELKQEEIEMIRGLMKDYPDKFILIALHHPPVSIGSPWMDKMSLRNPEALFSVIDGNDKVKGIIWGHIHQEFNRERAGVKLMAAPSTCIQFMPTATSYTKDNQPAGFRLLKLFNDGNITSSITRLP